MRQPRDMHAASLREDPSSRGCDPSTARVAQDRPTFDAASDDAWNLLAHELRTPVTVILGFLRLLLGEEVGPLTPEQRRFVEESARACTRLEAFVSRLVSDVRAKADPLDLEIREASLVRIAEGVAASLEPLLRARGLRLVAALPPEADRLRLDPLRIEQVLANLVGNAIAHSPAGGTIRIVGRANTAHGRRFAELSVDDEGPGVAVEDRERIFEPFVRAARVPASPGGLGLGLAICRRIVEAHGGRIGASDAPAGGARFWFTLPLGEAPRESAS